MALRECELRALGVWLLSLAACLSLGCGTAAPGREPGSARPGGGYASSPPPEGGAAGERPGSGPAGEAGGGLVGPRGGIQAAAAAGRPQGQALLRLEPAPVSDGGAGRWAAHQARADRAYEVKDFELAYREYLETANAAGPGSEVPPAVWLRLARIAFYENRDAESAAFYSGAAAAAGLEPADRELLQRLQTRLTWRQLTPAAIGLGDGNVSALRVDGDDLWVGTWNGGVARLSLASGEAKVFRQGRESLLPSTVRCVEITPTRVWVGTYQGLFVYSKTADQWQEVRAFGGPEPQKVEALRLADGRLYVGTLGGGLWRQEGEGWSRLSAGALPGDYVTCLEADGGELAIGTLTQGVVLLDLASSSFRSLDRLTRGLEARNITVLLAEPGEALWIGTYGLGVYRWEGRAKRLAHFSRAGGQLADDWVLCAARARVGTYFGTLGGGLSRFSPETGDWAVLGFRQGVSSPDVPAMAYGAPYLYLGSLGAGVTVLREGPRE